jgi:hypothetical protein
MALPFDLPSHSDLDDARDIVARVTATLRLTTEQLRSDLAAKAFSKQQHTVLDDIEDKVMASTALAAAASGTPEQAKAMLAKARAKAMQAAADGADTGALESMVRTMEHLAKVAEENREKQKHGQADASAAIIPALAALGKAS